MSEFDKRKTLKSLLLEASNMMGDISYLDAERICENYISKKYIPLSTLKQVIEDAFDFGILPDPNPYGKWVSVKNHNKVLKKMKSDVLTAITKMETEGK